MQRYFLSIQPLKVSVLLQEGLHIEVIKGHTATSIRKLQIYHIREKSIFNKILKLGIKTTIFNVTLVDDAIRVSINHFWTYNLVKVNRIYTNF